MRKLVAYAAALIAGAALVLSGPAAHAAACPALVTADAHRGGTTTWVENTGNAFRQAGITAARTGMTVNWETDIRFTSDGVPVIMHDETVDATTDGTGAVADLTYAQVAALRTADRQPVPTLADLVNDAYVDGATMYAELKTVPTEAQWDTLAAALATRPMTTKIVLTSFDGPTVLAAQAHLPAYARGLIQDVGDQSVASVTQWGTNILIKHHNAITWGRLGIWVSGGLSVRSWTVDSTSEWQRMNSYPAGWLDGLITNDPADYLAWGKARTC
jgi:glycerophosphoryl diester phosphodiesterase